MQEYNPKEWYTSEVALKRLIENSDGKKIDSAYLRSLARQGKIERIRLGDNFYLYKKNQVDEYEVKGRGEKWSKNNRKNKHIDEVLRDVEVRED
jgi:hypothetical protein